MPYQLERLHQATKNSQRWKLDERELRRRIEKLLDAEAPRYRRLWLYFRNPMLPLSTTSTTSDAQVSHRPYRLAQEWGLPPRITGVLNANEISSGDPLDGVARKEIVIENDIAWRVETMVDFLFGKPIAIRSLACDSSRRAQIEQLLGAIFANHGGITFLQQLALLGAVHGFVDVLVKLSSDFHELTSDAAGASVGIDDENDIVGSLPPRAESAPRAECPNPHPADSSQDLDSSTSDPGASETCSHDATLERIARAIRLEIIEPARALPLLNPEDWREVVAYVQCYTVSASASVRSKPGELRSPAKWVDRLLDKLAVRRTAGLLDEDDQTTVVELLTAHAWQRYENESLIASGTNSLGTIPLVHIQNTAVPFEYSGSSDVEPLIPIQDELNTRLCDRANRVTLQSFKMYLGKGIENFTSMPVAPGRMWMTDNEQAEIIEFGGDANSPSEDRHVVELREAMDKTSGVTPIAAGIVRNRIGYLTSAAALRVTMLALLARTERKRITYGGGIARICELALAWLDRAGLFHTTLDERRIAIDWPDPLPDLSPSPSGRGPG